MLTRSLARSVSPSSGNVSRRCNAGRAAEDLELHDDVIQQLFAIGVAMQTTEQRAADQPGFADRITDHLDGLHRVLQQVRSTLIDTEPEP